MTGGTGDDIYFVNAASEVRHRTAGEGTDEVRTNLATYSLALRPNIENLTGLGFGQSLTGNGLDNVITGVGRLDGGRARTR